VIVLEVCRNDIEIVKELVEQNDYVKILEPSNFDGDAIIQLIIEITKITAPLIAGVIIANSNGNKITIRRKGVNITMILNKKNLDKIELIKELLSMQKEDE